MRRRRRSRWLISQMFSFTGSRLEACDELEKDEVITAALGAHVTEQFLHAKRTEWREYISQVSAWELEQYLAKY